MIIKRKYATYGQLISDEITKAAIIQIFDKFNVSADVRNYIIDPYNDIIVFNTDMGSGIPGEAYKEIRQKLDELDVTNPFDNNLTYSDVSNTLSFSSRKGNAITQILYCKKVEMPIRIVQVLSFEYKDGKVNFIEPWDLGTIILN